MSAHTRSMVSPRYIAGTHRTTRPEETFARIAPLLPLAGITRCADVTGLDCIGIPSYCAVRPRGLALQVSNGKGLHPIDAKVSALMEGLEVHHAEHPIGIRVGSEASLRAEGLAVVSATDLPGYHSGRYYSETLQTKWCPAEDMRSGATVWLPAGSVYVSGPSPFEFDSNGLASGNTEAEATLHALYEVIERDVISGAFREGRLQLDDRCEVVDLETITSPPVLRLRDMVQGAGLQLRLLYLRSAIDVHTFWAMIVDPSPFASASAVHGGYGTHLNPAVAAIRAITEAAQSRLALIHGAREDLDERMYSWSKAHEKVSGFFARLHGSFSYAPLEDRTADSPQGDLEHVLGELSKNGYHHIYRTILTRPPFDIPVVKVQVMGLQRKEGLF